MSGRCIVVLESGEICGQPAVCIDECRGGAICPACWQRDELRRVLAASAGSSTLCVAWLQARRAIDRLGSADDVGERPF